MLSSMTVLIGASCGVVRSGLCQQHSCGRREERHWAHEATSSILRDDGRRCPECVHKRRSPQLRAAVERALPCARRQPCCSGAVHGQGRVPYAPLSTSPCTTAVTSSLVSSCCTGPRGWLTAAELQETDALGSPHLGTATIPVSELLSGQVVTGWHVLKHRTGRGVSFGKASIRVTVQYVPVSKARALCAAMTSKRPLDYLRCLPSSWSLTNASSCAVCGCIPCRA